MRVSRERERARWRAARKLALALIALGGRCRLCGEKDPFWLNIDHVNNDGHKDVSPGGSRLAALYAAYRDRWDRDKYQLLCVRCHWLKTRFSECSGRPTTREEDRDNRDTTYYERAKHHLRGHRDPPDCGSTTVPVEGMVDR